MRILAKIFILLIISTSAIAEEQALKISQIWARKSLSSQSNSAVYMLIENPTNTQISITEAMAPTVANNVELHKSFVDDRGISRMVHIDKIVVPPKSTIELKPGGIHIMLLDLQKQLTAGDEFKVILHTETKQQLTLTAIVR